MGELCLSPDMPINEDGSCSVLLSKDRKSICRTKCLKPHIGMPLVVEISEISRLKTDEIWGLPQCLLQPAPEDSRQGKEWGRFLLHLQDYKRVAIGRTDLYEYYVLPAAKYYVHPPAEGSNLRHAVLLYRKTPVKVNYSLNHEGSENRNVNKICVAARPTIESANTCLQDKLQSTKGESAVSVLHTVEDKCSLDSKIQEISGDHHVTGESGPMAKNYVQAHPSYLKTLGQAHSGWIFGAIAELVDNSRDAKATTLEISIETIYSNIVGKDIPILSVIDDGHGMTHQEIVRMLSFGHKQPDADDAERIGRFGIGFKTGAMRIGKDALVLTQTANSRSVAFLSQSLNEGNDNLEIPIVSYCRKGQFMELDTNVQDEAFAKSNLKAIKDFSPFNKYLIGEKAGLFRGKGTGTQIYIWNLDEWGSNYCLEWVAGMNGGSTFHQGDILIRSRRCRSRPGQMTRTVPLDFSLRAYLAVIFLDPRMKIFVQGSQVKSRPLARFLNKTVVENGVIMGKQVQLTLGRCQLEREQANCGIFLYWHGRLIEAYKRVGGMVHNGDRSHGIVGVIDVTDLMNEGNGRVWVHSNKQGFQDCELYAQLEEWLGKRADENLDDNFDKLPVKRISSLYKPDHEWVQCDKCRKWRMLNSGFDSQTLPEEWFCYMAPFNGKCDMPEVKPERGVVTVSAKRSAYSPKDNLVEQKNGLLPKDNSRSDGGSDEFIRPSEDVTLPPLKRLKRGPSRGKN